MIGYFDLNYFESLCYAALQQAQQCLSTAEVSSEITGGEKHSCNTAQANISRLKRLIIFYATTFEAYTKYYRNSSM